MANDNTSERWEESLGALRKGAQFELLAVYDMLYDQPDTCLVFMAFGHRLRSALALAVMAIELVLEDSTSDHERVASARKAIANVRNLLPVSQLWPSSSEKGGGDNRAAE